MIIYKKWTILLCLTWYIWFSVTKSTRFSASILYVDIMFTYCCSIYKQLLAVEVFVKTVTCKRYQELSIICTTNCKTRNRVDIVYI